MSLLTMADIKYTCIIDRLAPKTFHFFPIEGALIQIIMFPALYISGQGLPTAFNLISTV